MRIEIDEEREVVLVYHGSELVQAMSYTQLRSNCGFVILPNQYQREEQPHDNNA